MTEALNKVAVEATAPNYYTVLQVHPEAENEVIEAAYRQLMKKYHPDLAGDDPIQIALHNQRAKMINQAFSVLRDPESRRRYDATHWSPSSRPSAGPARAATANAARRGASDPPPPPQSSPAWDEVEELTPGHGLRGPLALLSAAYYLLPGAYEWEADRHRELRAVFLLPPVGVAGFTLATGRLAPWIGHSLTSTLVAWAILALLCLPMLSSVPRLALAGLPTLILLSGSLDGLVRQAHLSSLLVAGLLGIVGLVLAARLYIFAVLPTLAVCLLISRLS